MPGRIRLSSASATSPHWPTCRRRNVRRGNASGPTWTGSLAPHGRNRSLSLRDGLHLLVPNVQSGNEETQLHATTAAIVVRPRRPVCAPRGSPSHQPRTDSCMKGTHYVVFILPEPLLRTPAPPAPRTSGRSLPAQL